MRADVIFHRVESVRRSDGIRHFSADIIDVFQRRFLHVFPLRLLEKIR